MKTWIWGVGGAVLAAGIAGGTMYVGYNSGLDSGRTENADLVEALESSQNSAFTMGILVGRAVDNGDLTSAQVMDACEGKMMVQCAESIKKDLENSAKKDKDQSDDSGTPL